MRGRREQVRGIDIWPGFVDALSTLLLAVIFMLVVFVLGQFFLSQMLQRRNQTVVQLESAVADLRSRLDLEQDTTADLRRGMQQLSADLQLALTDRDELTAQLTAREQETTA